MSDIELIQRKLKDKGYKLTNQRKAIIEVLFEHKEHFLTAEDIYIKSIEKLPDTNFSTIYRNLSMLEDAGIIHNTQIDGSASVYGLISNMNHHHHIICKNCGKTEAIDFCPLEEMWSRIDNKSFTLTGHKLELYGLCMDCERKRKKDK